MSGEVKRLYDIDSSLTLRMTGIIVFKETAHMTAGVDIYIIT